MKSFRHLFPWIVFIISFVIIKFYGPVTVVQAVADVCFVLGFSAVTVSIMAPGLFNFLNRFISGELIEYTNQAALGALMWFIIFTATLITIWIN